MWTSFCEQLRETGRRAGLFILALLAWFAVALAWVWFELHFGEEHPVPRKVAVIAAIGGTVLGSMTGLVAAGLIQRRRRLNRASACHPHFGPLSSDEWRVARSKLLKKMK